MESAPVITSICGLCGIPIYKRGNDPWCWTYTDDAEHQFHFPFCGDSMDDHQPNETLVVEQLLKEYERTT
jgi:hypothetical protein